MDVPVRDDFVITKIAYDKLEGRYQVVVNSGIGYMCNLFDTHSGDSINNLTYREKEAIVSTVNGYKFGGEAANPERAMIKGSRGSEGFEYTSYGRTTKDGGLV